MTGTGMTHQGEELTPVLKKAADLLDSFGVAYNILTVVTRSVVGTYPGDIQRIQKQRMELSAVYRLS